MIKFNFDKELTKNFFWKSLQLLSKQSLILFIFFISAKILNPVDFGLLNYLLAIVLLLTTFSDFGISTSTSKYVAKYVNIDKEKINYVLFSSAFFVFLVGGILTLLLVLFSNGRLEYLAYFSPLLFFIPLTSLYDGIYLGLKKFKSSAKINFLASFILFIISYFLVINYGLIGSIISYNLFYFLLFLIYLLNEKDLKFTIKKEIITEIVPYAFIIGFGKLSHFFYTKVDVLILGMFNFLKQISYYEIIFKFIQTVGLPFWIFSGPLPMPWPVSLCSSSSPLVNLCLSL